MSIHNYERHYITSKKRLEESTISQRNKDLILSFTNDKILAGISRPRLMKYMGVLRKVAEILEKDLDKADIQDIKGVVGIIQQRNDYAVWTKHMYKVIIRTFYKWLAGTKHYPEIVDWISIRISRSEQNLPAEGDLLRDCHKITAPICGITI